LFWFSGVGLAVVSSSGLGAGFGTHGFNIRISITILVILMGNQITVTAKIPSELKERLAKLGVNVSELVREALQCEVERLERERRRKLAEEAGEIFQKIPVAEFVEAVRASRENR
jgi:post-segregation antitoxin (ccd killing protein)